MRFRHVDFFRFPLVVFLLSLTTVTFPVSAQFVISGRITTPTGHDLDRPFSVHAWAIDPESLELEESWAMSDPDNGRFVLDVTNGVYWLILDGPAPYWAPATPVDARNRDVRNVDIRLSEHPLSILPTDPPDGTRITIGTPDDLGEASVSGSAGAVEPYSVVLLINQMSTQQAVAIAGGDGSFSAKIFAPPGSAILIRHGPAGPQWSELHRGTESGVNPMPATIVTAPGRNPPGSGQGFTGIGPLMRSSDIGDEPPENTTGAAWILEGRFRAGSSPDDTPVTISPGEFLQITGNMRIYSPAFDPADDLSELEVRLIPILAPLFDADGHQITPIEENISSFLTPGGLPVSGGPCLIGLMPPNEIRGFEVATRNSVEADFSGEILIPAEVPAGVYMLGVRAEAENLPSGSSWQSAAVWGPNFPGDSMLSPVVVDSGNDVVSERRMVWGLLTGVISDGQYGTLSREDAGAFGIAPHVVTQGAPYILRPRDPYTGDLIFYRIEPYLPGFGDTDRRLPYPSPIPWKLPGGSLKLEITAHDGSVRSIGPEPFTQPLIQTPSSITGGDYNFGSTQFNDITSLTTSSPDFHLSFPLYGHYVIKMSGWIEDIRGMRYSGGGSYDIWVAEPLDMDPGALPGTPFDAGQSLSTALQLLPGVPARITWRISRYPDSDPAKAAIETLSFRADTFGFSPGLPVLMDTPGEYRIDVTASYLDADGILYMGARTWGGVIMTPRSRITLEAHGRRGAQCLEGNEPSAWFLLSGLGIGSDIPCHFFNPYFNGDVFWSRMEDPNYSGDALLVMASVRDLRGNATQKLINRAQTAEIEIPPERISAGELPLLTLGDSPIPVLLNPSRTVQIAYAYRYAERPGVRVREVIGTDQSDGGYWRYDSFYDAQPGVGFAGDLPNDFKFQYVSTVYRDLQEGTAEYDGQGSLWVYIPPEDSTGPRVMPPFSGDGNDGWTTLGGPIMTLDGKDLDIFILPTGIRPGSICEVGSTVGFAGHVAPTVDAKTNVALTAPDGTTQTAQGQANRVGYLSLSGSRFTIDQPGVWKITTDVWHDGRCSGGQLVSPYPHGTVPGDENGSFVFYAVDRRAEPLVLETPAEGMLAFDPEDPTIHIRIRIPSGVTDGVLDETVTMPGFILEHRTISVSPGVLEIGYDPVLLSERFPNIDLVSRDDLTRPGLADTIRFSFLLSGKLGGREIHRAGSLTLQGEEIRRPSPPPAARLPDGRVADL